MVWNEGISGCMCINVWCNFTGKETLEKPLWTQNDAKPNLLFQIRRTKVTSRCSHVLMWIYTQVKFVIIPTLSLQMQMLLTLWRHGGGGGSRKNENETELDFKKGESLYIQITILSVLTDALIRCWSPALLSRPYVHRCYCGNISHQRQNINSTKHVFISPQKRSMLILYRHGLFYRK